MRLKDWINGLYVFGESRDRGTCDLCWAQDDLLTGVKRSEADAIVKLVDNYTSAIWWLFDQATPEVQEKFRDLTSDTGAPIRGDFSAKAWGEQ